MNAVAFRPVSPPDLDALLPVIRQFHADEGIAWREARVRGALETLLLEPASGRLTLIERNGELAGYLMIGFCFSLEFGGRHGLIDELYVLPPQRGGGLGKQILAEAEAICRREDLACLRLEVSDDNPRARALYERTGYAAHPRRLMTKWLGDVAAD
jgi:ribosomal protein S18 acetylase RimI-like enzyme